MPEYIESTKMADVIHRYFVGYKVEDMIRDIRKEAIADVAPVVHGRWIWNEECHCWVCSNCYLSALNNYRGWSTESNYCPNCGARMDGE